MSKYNVLALAKNGKYLSSLLRLSGNYQTLLRAARKRQSLSKFAAHTENNNSYLVKILRFYYMTQMVYQL
jgi:hypothetical protein